MAIQLESGVGFYNENKHFKLEFVGVKQVNGQYVKRQFAVGVYTFSNPYSANMFSYLLKKYNKQDDAKATVLLFEEKLAASAAASFWNFVQIDWQALISEKSLKLDWVGIMTELAVAAGGWAFTKLKQGSAVGNFNPYSAQQDREQYVFYAIAYWKQNPTYGPAYKNAQW
jgi:hypothetical protein